jgi:hypothetical protein
LAIHRGIDKRSSSSSSSETGAYALASRRPRGE